MKSFSCLSLIFLLQLILLPVLLLSCPVPNDTSLIEKTCKKTPYHDLCVSSLESNPNSSYADVSGLAEIIIDSALLNATDTLNYTRLLINQMSDPTTERPLDYCAELYIPVVKYTLPQGKDAFDKGQYKFALYCLSNAAKQADTCDKMFHDSIVKPLSDRNNIFRELCSVAVAIINIVLKGK
ncbi:cell wall / vacuolar inhibitor of fructosidase 1-like [Punica granatum]|uniref:Cell wall / vacuolar inhibitor of fructosidase 1-like n=1 Tax=Punica granatum TaxID=22663 RepID=A0A218XS65_PUNGR|nr:cell wall / vacuolar inhibitor of fructosidase 1-like [Punica granatum]OWM88025.1 hypothetical protein CDL15_Pgr016598 [Punica granatum]